MCKSFKKGQEQPHPEMPHRYVCPDCLNHPQQKDLEAEADCKNTFWDDELKMNVEQCCCWSDVHSPNRHAMDEKGIGGCKYFNWISTTIKKVYMDQILKGIKKAEFKGATDFWKKRLDKYKNFEDGTLGINFLCGQNSYKFFVKDIYKWNGTRPLDIDGKEFHTYYQILLGDRIEP